MRLKYPRDRFPYPRRKGSKPINLDTPVGPYVFVQDEDGEIFVLRDTEPHLHPLVLGEGRPGRYAGDLTLDEGHVISDLTNLSGTFRFKRKGGLLAIAFLLRRGGFTIAPGAVRWFPPDGSSRPETLE
jgi:hypothetical protein